MEYKQQIHSCLFLTVCMSIGAISVRATDIIAFPPPSVTSSPDVKLAYTYFPEEDTFDLKWVVAHGNPQLSDSAYIGIGFQNGLEANTPEDNLAMYGPSGTDFFILRGNESNTIIEFRTLPEKTATTPKGYPPSSRELYQNSSLFQCGNRILGLSISPLPTGYTTYAVTVDCEKGSNGMTDFHSPVAVLFAFGPVINGQVSRHPSKASARGWKRSGLSSNDSLVLYTICSLTGNAATPHILSISSLIFLAFLILRAT